MAPQLRHTWYENPFTLSGQLMFECQHPRNTIAAAPAKLVITTPGSHQLDFRIPSDFGATTGSLIVSSRLSVLLLSP